MKTSFMCFFRQLVYSGLVFVSTSLGSQAFAEDLKIEEAILTYAPEVPPPINRKEPAKVVVHLETKEIVSKLSDGVDYTFWTFGGQVPGKFIRIREGDLVEFHLSNHPSSKMPHNIDLHAVTGPGGGASSSFTAPGHSSTFSFTALNPGLFIYHCATAPVGMHISNGMYGLIFVEPKEGLPRVDHEYYVLQSEFYTKGKYGSRGLQPFSMEKALDEKPDYVVFNGSVGSTTADRALKAKAGETVRLFVGNAGPNLVSSFHMIGEIFDKVYVEGGMTINTDVQTTLIPAGGASIVDLKVQVPGTYIMVDHSIFRAFNKGALAQLKVEGDEDKKTFSGKQKDEVYLPEGSNIQNILTPNAPVPPLAKNRAERIALGKRVFETNCAACHQINGEGIPHAFPPLAKSDFLNGNKARAVEAVVKGLNGKITVNGAIYDGVMPAWALSDDEIANVLTYVYGSWGNSSKEVTPEEVHAEKAKGVKK